jgi:hypothetical protein
MTVRYPAASHLSYVRIVQASSSIALSVVCSALLSFTCLVHLCNSLLRFLAVYNITELVVVVMMTDDVS